MPLFTVRNATKFVAKTLVAAKAAEITEDVITDHTRFDEDDTVVDITGKLVGWYVSEKLEPYTDKVVDKAADVVVTIKSKFKQNKTEDAV